MPEKLPRQFEPDYAVAPGATLRETLDAMGLSQADLAERTGRPKKTINEIVQGKAAITPETALQLERVLGTPASFWNNLERAYRANLAREAERARLREQLPWLREFPLKDMAQREWIVRRDDQVETLRELLRFFGVVSPSAWHDVWDTTRKATAYRQAKGKSIDFAGVAAWLRQGEIQGRSLKCLPFDAATFRAALKQIRPLSKLDPKVFCPKVQELCADAGVAVVFVQELPRIRMFGAARWLSPEKALIQLSLYYKSEDQLWFSLFHEAGHVLLHGRREVFVDPQGAALDRHEREANEFASNNLIDPHQYAAFVAAGDFTRTAVVDFATSIDIVPGIVVGRLQHDKHLPFNQLSNLKRRLEWA